MAWLKIDESMLDSPAILIMKRHLACTQGDAFLLAQRWLFYLDKNTKDGKTRLLPDEINTIFRTPSFADALIAATWAKLEKDGTISAQDYELHNGENTKKRLMQSIYDSRRSQTKTRTKSGKSQNQNWKTPEQNLENPRTESGQEKRREENIERERETITTRSIDPPPATSPTPPRKNDYLTWITAIKNAHPAGRELQSFLGNPKLRDAARAAYAALPQAAESADLLRAFYTSTLTTSTSGRPFKRPLELLWYFTDLADIIVSARQWAKETRWKPHSERKPTNLTTTPPQPRTPAETITEADKTAFFADLNQP